MTLVKRNGNLLNQLPMLFDDFFSKDFYNFGNPGFSDTNTTVPAVNIKETPVNYEVEVAAPGMNKNDFKIQLDGNCLTITSEKTETQPGNPEEKFSQKEFSYQSFSRRFDLRKEVMDMDKIQATYRDGVLRLQIPKKEEAKQKPVRLIQVS